jgi:hypothetical protein
MHKTFPDFDRGAHFSLRRIFERIFAGRSTPEQVSHLALHSHLTSAQLAGDHLVNQARFTCFPSSNFSLHSALVISLRRLEFNGGTRRESSLQSVLALVEGTEEHLCTL